MNTECPSTSLHSVIQRFQQPRRTLSPPENAAAGDAPRSQISSELNLNINSSAEIFTMDTSRPSISQLWSFPNNPMDKVVSSTDEDSASNKRARGSRLAEFNDQESRFPPNLSSRQSLKRSRNGDRNAVDNQRPFENFPGNDRADLNRVLSPDRKISMFSAEIWTEKVLPTNTFVHPEPELVEIYFDKNTTSNQFNHFGGYSRESLEVPSMWTGSDCGILGSANPTSPLLSPRKSRTSSLGQKTINFDDEIWPVCPMLIPSEKELSPSNLQKKYDIISPEKLNAHGEETIGIPRLETEPLIMKGASIFDIPSSPSAKHYESENNSKGSKVIEPTHEIEYQNTNTDLPEKLQTSYNVDGISRETNSLASTPRQLQKYNLEDGDLRPEPSAEVITHRESEQEGGKKATEKFIVDYDYEKPDKIPAISCKENRSMDKIEFEHIKENFNSNSEACRITKKIGFASVKNPEDDYGFLEEQTTSPPGSEPRTIGSREVEESVNERKIKKNRKSAKVVRFQTITDSESSDIEIVESVTRKEKNLKLNHLRRDPSRTHIAFDDGSEMPDFRSVESFQRGQKHIADKIGRQVEMDPALEDALEALAKIERIVENNLQMEEKLQQLQPNVAVLWPTPPDAEKSLSKALMRCRKYMLNNGYSNGATTTIDKLLTSTVQDLKRLVEEQRLALVAQEKHRSASSGRRQSTRSHHDYFPNSKGASTASEIGTNQMKILIADILTSTEKLIPKLVTNQTQKKSSINGSKNSNKNSKIPPDTFHSKKNKTSSPKELNIRSEVQECEASVHENQLTRYHHKELFKDFENSYSLVPPAKYPKKLPPSEPTKSLRNLFNDLWENRSKNVPRHYSVNESTTSNSRGRHNTSISHKLPAWKPGGNNSVQSSVNIVPNNHKNRSVISSSAHKRKNPGNEQAREPKLQQRTKVAAGIAKDSSKIAEKLIIKAHDSISPAKVRKAQVKGHQSDLGSVDKKKVQILTETDETRARKPRSKSRTRTKNPIKVPSITVTEVPLEQCKEYLPTLERKMTVAEEVPLGKKASSCPKVIVKMLEELIRSSSHETAIRNASSVQIVARCNAAVKEDVSNFLPLKSESREITETDSHSSSNKDHYRTKALSENESVRLKFAQEDVVSENTTEVIGDVTESQNLSKELDLFSKFPSNKKVSQSQTLEEPNKPSASNVDCTADLDSEHSIGYVSSKYCQASLTSLTSHEVSEEISHSQVSDTTISSRCEEASKDSNESFDTVENEEVTRDECIQRYQRDRCVTTENFVTPKKKFINRHARSLEMLKEILSDQGLGIHLLSRAESEIQGRRYKCSSSKKGLATRRSLGASSSTLINKLSTLSESESETEQVEVATMTSANGSAGSMKDAKRSLEFESHYNKGYKTLLNGVITVENATQFDIPLKFDMCVGDELDSNTLIPPNTKNEHILANNPEAPCTLPLTFHPSNSNHEEQAADKIETFECKLPNEILEAFRLAAIRAENLYTAFRILKEDMPSYPIRNLNGIITHTSTSKPKSAADSCPFDVSDRVPGQDQILSKLFSSYNHKESSLRHLEKSKTDPPLKIIIPRIRKNLTVEQSELGTEKSQARNTATRNAIGVKNTENKVADNDSQRSSNSDNKVNPMKPLVRTKLSKYMAPPENKFARCPEIPRRIAGVQVKNNRFPPQNQESFIDRSGNEKPIETLHFARRQSPSVIVDSSKAGSKVIDVRTSTQSSLDANSLNHRSPKTPTEIQESLPVSRIKTLLEKNLQRFNVDYNPTDDEVILKDFRDQRPAESSDDEAVINEIFIETATSISRTHLADCNILPEVKNFVNCLVNEVAENWESTSMNGHQDVCSSSRKQRRVGNPVQRKKSDRGKRAVKCGNRLILGRQNLNTLIVSREHLLFLIYAAICSFVFCCLQFTVYCEV